MSLKHEAAPDTPMPAKKFRFQQVQVNSTEHLYLAEKFSDVHFIFISDDGTTPVKRVPGHRNLLAADSDIFEQMFYGELKENGDVTIVDASTAAFEEFLQFFYLSEVKLSVEHIGGVMYLGHKYNVKKCVDGCVKMLRDDMTNENVCTILPLVNFDEQDKLMKICEKRILLNSAEVFASDGFLECSKEALAHILKMNVLPCSEVEVFEACMAWVKAKSGEDSLSRETVEQYLGDLYREIRFVSMTIGEFCALKTKYSAVLSNDFENVIRLIARIDIHSEQFNAFPRQVQWNGGACLTCDRKYYNTMARRYTLDTEEKTTFTTNEPIVLGNFTCDKIFVGKTSSRDLRSSLSVDVKITEAHTSNGLNAKVLWNSRANLNSKHTIVSLPHPLLIRPEFFYTICIRKFPDDHCYYSKEFKNVLKLDSDIFIKFHNDKIIKRLAVGFISVLNFNKI